MTSFDSVVDTGGKFATGVNDTRWQTMGTIIKLLSTLNELEEGPFQIFSKTLKDIRISRCLGSRVSI